MAKTRQIVRPHIRLQKLQRDIRKQFGTYKTTYLARVDGTVRLPRGLFWVHDATGTDANGNTVYGAPRKMPMLAGAAIIPRPNTRVDVITINGVDHIARTNAAELDRMGFDAHQSNTFDPAAQFKSLDWIINLQAFKTPGVSSTHVIGSIYKKPDGTYEVFRTEGALDFVTANIPSTDMQVVVCQWLNTNTNAVTSTVSSEISRDIDLKRAENLTDTMALINECAAVAPAHHIGITAWRIYDDTTITTLNDTNKLADLRGIVGNSRSNVLSLLTTEDAIAATLASIPIASSSVVRVVGEVIGAKVDYSAAAGRGFSITARRDASGDVTLVGAAQYDAAIQEDSSGAPVITVDADTSTQAVRVRVQGISAEEWRWKVEYRVIELAE